jgi:hypothetical protein
MRTLPSRRTMGGISSVSSALQGGVCVWVTAQGMTGTVEIEL